MIVNVKAVACGSALFLLAACNGNGDTQVAADSAATQFQEALDANDALRTQVLARSGTAFSAMPNDGSAIYTGFATGTIDGGTGALADGVTLQGDMTVTATFGDGTKGLRADSVVGSIENIEGYRGDTLDEDSIVSIGGEMNIGMLRSNIGYGDPSNTDVPNQFRTSIGGVMDIDGTQVVVGGELEGRFYGTRTQPAAGESAVWSLQASEDDGTADVDGEIRDFALEIVGQN